MFGIKLVHSWVMSSKHEAEADIRGQLYVYIYKSYAGIFNWLAGKTYFSAWWVCHLKDSCETSRWWFLSEKSVKNIKHRSVFS